MRRRMLRPLAGALCAAALAAPPAPAVTAHDAYDLSAPAEAHRLPDVLREVSGIVWLAPDLIACVQDELGTIFFFNPGLGKIVRELPFGGPGDYEGLARVEDALYVLRSDGHLFEIAGFSGETPAVRSYATGVPAANNEGLCHDPQGARLLIAAKGEAGDTEEDRARRVIHAFDLRTRRLCPEPAFVFAVVDLQRAAAADGVTRPAKNKKKPEGPSLKGVASAIAIHPSTGDLFVLSAADHLLFTADRAGRIRTLSALDPARLPQPEGLSFDRDGGLLISSEGREGQAVLLRFRPAGD